MLRYVHIGGMWQMGAQPVMTRLLEGRTTATRTFQPETKNCWSVAQKLLIR